jgi:hypothetical protein
MTTVRTPQGSGAPADADPALVASDQAASRLAPSGFDPSRITVGDWIVIPGWRSAAVELVTRVTPKLVYAKQGSWRAFQRKRETVIAAFADEQAARDLAQQFGGAAGQRDDRIRKAQRDFNERKAAAVAAYDKTAARLVAIAMEARQGADPEEGLDGEAMTARVRRTSPRINPMNPNNPPTSPDGLSRHEL